MPEFLCELCQYKTSRKDTYNVHLESRKHINLKLGKNKKLKSECIEELNNTVPLDIDTTNSTILAPTGPTFRCPTPVNLNLNNHNNILHLKPHQCKYCMKEYSRKYTLDRHLVRCPKRLEDEVIEKERLKQELEQVKLAQLLKDKDHELALERKENEFLKREIKIKDQCIQTTVKTYNNALKFAKMHFKNPKNLDSYCCYIVDKDASDDETMRLIDEFVHREINDSGANFIADYIWNHYKTPKISDQSFHNSDAQRRNFIVFQKTWLWDKEGHKIKAEVISPLLDQMKIPLGKYVKLNAELIAKYAMKGKVRNTEMLIKCADVANSVINNIDNGSYHDRILSYLSPKVYLNMNDQKLLCE